MCKKLILTLVSCVCRVEYYISQSGSKQQQAILEGVCSESVGIPVAFFRPFHTPFVSVTD